MASQAFIEQCSECEQVATPIDRFSSCLFGRKIERRANYDVAAGLGRINRLCIEIHTACRRFKQVFDQTKVEHFDVATFADENVRRLYVAVYDTLLVCFSQSFRNG